MVEITTSKRLDSRAPLSVPNPSCWAVLTSLQRHHIDTCMNVYPWPREGNWSGPLPSLSHGHVKVEVQAVMDSALVAVS